MTPHSISERHEPYAANLQTSSKPTTSREKALAALQNLPPFSPVLNKLLASLAGEYVSYSQLGELIEKDAVIAGNLLKLVNSAMYARRVEITSVRHGLSVLGIDKVRNSVLAMSISRMLSQAQAPREWSMQAFNKHSAAVAVMADQIAQNVPTEYPEGAFVAGLFHDIGKLLIAIGIPAQFRQIVALYHDAHSSDLDWLECERRTIDFTHAELSTEALAVWKLPAPILIAAKEHHQLSPLRPGDPPALSGDPLPLGFVVAVANQYVNSIGDSILPEPKESEADPAWLESLGLTEEALERMLASFHEEHSAFAQFYQ